MIGTSDSIPFAVLNVDEYSLCQSMPDNSLQLFCKYTEMFDILFDAVPVSPIWLALVPTTLCGDSIEELMWHMRILHLHHVAWPVRVCPEDDGHNAS